MSLFEEELKHALRREEAPPHLLEHVLRAAESTRKQPIWPLWLTVRRSMAAAAVASLFLLGGAGALYQRHQAEERGQEAKRQLLTALRVTGSKLQKVEGAAAQMLYRKDGGR